MEQEVKFAWGSTAGTSGPSIQAEGCHMCSKQAHQSLLQHPQGPETFETSPSQLIGHQHIYNRERHGGNYQMVREMIKIPIVPIVDTKIDGHSYVQGHLNVGHQCIAMYVRGAYIFRN